MKLDELKQIQEEIQKEQKLMDESAGKLPIGHLRMDGDKNYRAMYYCRLREAFNLGIAMMTELSDNDREEEIKRFRDYINQRHIEAICDFEHEKYHSSGNVRSFIV